MFPKAAFTPGFAVDLRNDAKKTGWLYLAFILDLCSRYAVGWATGDRINNDLVIRALMMAITQRSPQAGFILHSDQGSQYRSTLFQSILRFHGGRPSMGTSGDCYDNAVRESFNATLKGECLDHEQLITRDYAKKIIFDFIECFYNRERIRSTLGYVSPKQFEKLLSMQLFMPSIGVHKVQMRVCWLPDLGELRRSRGQ
jgi:transposase InsO family protein